MEFDYDQKTHMLGGFPKYRKLGAVSWNGESTPFFFGGRSYRLELRDASHGTDAGSDIKAEIIDRADGSVVSSFGEGCYYYSLFTENDKVYVTGTVSFKDRLCGDAVRLYISEDLVNWEYRELLSRPGLEYYNTSLTKGDNGYVIALEAGKPAEYVGDHPFTVFFAVSEDMKNWEFIDSGFSKDRYMGGPCLKYSRGWYYLFSVTALPCRRYTNYLYRTRDFKDWEVGLYNPILSPDEDDRVIADASRLTEAQRDEVRTGMIISSSDIDLCGTPDGKTLITYNVGNQLGFYYMCEAIYDGTPDELLERNFR